MDATRTETESMFSDYSEAMSFSTGSKRMKTGGSTVDGLRSVVPAPFG